MQRYKTPITLLFFIALMKIFDRLKLVFLLALLGGCASVDAPKRDTPQPATAPVQKVKGVPNVMVEELARAAIPVDAIGVYVHDTASGETLASFNANLPLNPASTMKLVTTNAGLELLGPAFRWQTQAYGTGAMVGDVLLGDLIIRGSGDPKLVLENLWLFLRQIRAYGIREIRGNLQLDRSLFEGYFYDAAAFDNDPFKPYNVGPDALLLNYKSMIFKFVPDADKKTVKVGSDPLLAGSLVVPPKLVKGDCGDWRKKLLPSVSASGAVFAGEYAMSCGEKVWQIHPHQLSHAEYFAGVFRQMWTELGGSLQGDTTLGPVPLDARLIAEWNSPPLADIIRDINKYSNNVMARQMLYALGAGPTQSTLSAQQGALNVKTWLAGKGIDAPELVIENGSGLSRIERISAGSLGRMLMAAYRSPLMPEFISSMPLVGLDGSMRRRLVANGITGRAHIKTGSLVDVRAIAGYVLSAGGKRYAVVSIVNHPNAWAAREAHDALLQWVYEQK